MTVKPYPGYNCLCEHCRSAWGKPAGLRDREYRATLWGPLWRYKGLYRAEFDPIPDSYEQGLP